MLRASNIGPGAEPEAFLYLLSCFRLRKPNTHDEARNSSDLAYTDCTSPDSILLPTRSVLHPDLEECICTGNCVLR